MVRDNRITGYFKGVINHIPAGFAISNDVPYMTMPTSGQSFMYQISESLINQSLNILLGRNYIYKTISYDFAKSINFPIEFTSTQLEGAVPGLCNSIGYDVKLDTRWSNVGAPKFIFGNGNVKVLFSMLIEVYDRAHSKQYMDIHYDGMEVDFNLALGSDMFLNIDWNKIKLARARITPHIDLKRKLDQTTILNFFNWTFDMIVPWVKIQHPENVSKFKVPTHFDNIIDIRDLHMESRKNYLHFGMDPTFLFAN